MQDQNAASHSEAMKRYQELLATSQNFTLDDLAANRSGHLTERQIPSRLKKTVSLIVGVISILVVFFGIAEMFITEIGAGTIIAVIGLLGILGAGGVWVTVKNQYVLKSQEYFSKGKQEFWNGPIRYKTNYYLESTETRKMFAVTRATFDVFNEVLPHRIYYGIGYDTPSHSHVFSIENLPTDLAKDYFSSAQTSSSKGA